MTLTARPGKIYEPADLSFFKNLLLRTCGHSFENEREQALAAALQRRMAALDVKSLESYQVLLLRDHDELLRLTELLTVNETYFFREPEHLNLVIDKLLPELMAANARRPVRILSAGCSTGEEPYSLAIMLQERFGVASEQLFAITGVDIDSTVIASAIKGAYGRSSFRGMNQAMLDRYFEPAAPGEFRVRNVIRKQVRFEIVNLLGADYPESMLSPDIILYRNVSIYFPGQVQREIFGKLAELLADGGCILVGASETFHHDIGILSLVKQESLFYYRKTSMFVIEERRTSSRRSPAYERTRCGGVKSAPVSMVKPEVRKTREHGGHINEPITKQHALSRLDVKERFDAAISQAHNKQYDKALAMIDTIIEEDSAFLKAYCLKGSLLISISRFDEAEIVCNSVISRDPLCLEAYLMLGIIAKHYGKDDDAARRFREAIYLNSSCWPAHFYSAEISYSQRDERKALTGYEAASRILERDSLQKRGHEFFPLIFNAEQFSVICRHKLSLLTQNKGKKWQ